MHRFSRGLRIVALAASLGVSSGTASAQAHARAHDDPELVAALREDAATRACACIVGASWILESYPRVVVRGARWRALGARARRRFAVAALRDAEAVYAREWGTSDFYETVYVVDPRGTVLSTYQRER